MHEIGPHRSGHAHPAASHTLTRSTCRPRQRTVAVLEERHSTVVELEYLNPSRVVPSLTFSTSSFLLSLALSLEGKESCQNESGETRGEDGRLKQSTKSTICCCLPLSSSQAACNDATVCLDSIHNVADHSRVLSNHACSLLFLLVFRHLPSLVSGRQRSI